MKFNHIMCKRLVGVLLCLLTLTPIVSAQHRWALVIGISHYQDGSGWPDIHGTNDADLIADRLKGFDLTVLKNEEANRNNIVAGLNHICANAYRGDVVYIHFSGHGQPFEDTNNDEADGWDESFVPYDALLAYREDEYTGENHLTDDYFERVFDEIRNKLGPEGFLFAVFDACHSGTMGRDNDIFSNEDYLPTRGTYIGFSKEKIYHPKRSESINAIAIDHNQKLSDIIVLEACKADQTNKEIIVDDVFYGPLSYSIATVIDNMGLIGNAQWSHSVRKEMEHLISDNRRQELVIESSVQ